MTVVAETFVTPSSSNIESAAYDPEVENLTVTFRDGSEYLYYNVPGSVYRGIQGAASAGRYFAQFIKGRYAYEQQ